MEVAAVKFALGKLNVLLNMGLELYHVSDEVTHIQLALRMIHCFLQDVHSKRNAANSAVKQWVNEVRDVAYRIEDTIDTFLVDIKDNRARNFGVCSKLVRLIKKPLKVKKLVDEIKAIRSTLETISQLRIQLGITDASVSSPQFDEVLLRRASSSDVDDSKVIGFDAYKREIIDQLLATNISIRVVLSIVGMGGLGKTTLAQKVYKSNELERHFECRIWLSISQKFDVQNILREILYSVEPHLRKENPTIRHEDLRTKLGESLTRRRYLIVLDDVWTIDLWESLKKALPDGNNASRVLITTRILDVARAADGTTHELRHLNEDDSLTLLFQKANIPIEEPGLQHRSDLNDVARQLTKKCGGLPLALIVLGSILSTREPTKKAWQRVHDTLDWHNEKATGCSKVLLLSYVDLPYYLKPCFLYFASFPEDHQISAKLIIRMWIAEGFIPRGGHGTMEERAQDFLGELLQRGLVQGIEKSWDGRCKRCGVHDLVRDMAIHEAMQENFFTVFTKEDDEIQFSAQKRRTVDFKGTSISFTGSNEFNEFDKYRLVLPMLLQRNPVCSLWKIPSLRHVNVGSLFGGLLRRWFVPLTGDHCKNIQTLKISMPSMRIYIKERWKNLRALLKQTEHLISLAIRSDHLPLLSEGTRDLSCHETIQTLTLCGKWRIDLCVFDLEMFPTNLTKLTLKFTQLKEDPMPTLEKLQSLTILRLLDGSYDADRRNFFVRTKLTCTEEGFPSLEKLELRGLSTLSHWDIKEGAMPELSHLKMANLFNHILTPPVFPELQNVPTLRNLELDEHLYAISREEENHYKIQHIHSVRKLKWETNYV